MLVKVDLSSRIFSWLPLCSIFLRFLYIPIVSERIVFNCEVDFCKLLGGSQSLVIGSGPGV